MKKALFFDVDGTLVTSGGEMSPKVKEAIEKVRKNGNYVFLCTGRNKRGVNDLIKYFDGMICSAGGYIEFENQEIYKEFMLEEEIEAVRDIFTRNHILYNLEGTEITFQSDGLDQLFIAGNIDEKNINSEMRRLMDEHNKRFNSHSLEEYQQNAARIHKMCFVAKNPEDLEEPRRLLSHKYNFIIHEIFSKDVVNGEIIKKDMNKAKAIEIIIDKLGIDLKDTICFGDSMNDYEMVQLCHHSVVMENGSAELKKHATSICESVENDGIYHELKRLNFCR